MKLKGCLKSNAEAHAEDHIGVHTENYARAHAENHVEAHAKGLAEVHVEEQEPILILLPDMDTVDQPAKGEILLENNEIEEIVANLPDESSYAPETAQAITTYLQVINESVATEEILDDEEINSIVQVNENGKSIGQEIDEDKVPDLLVIAAEVFNAMQTVIHYKEQEISELNFSLEELEFLKNLLKEYKYIYKKLKKQKKITNSYSQDPYSQDSYFQDSYSRGPYFQDSDLQKSDFQESDSQESDSQKSDS
ncbi:22986_t:CDS:2 [Gigaspora margarita]|uniref:22986_t:CDS:1 n=1 Tax=Gigaspora margarita TaxID=4874 RepID=A0ABN7VTQ9_GIGMA|nr:22986_t:CDS:2 [Gigaspora margarita]